LSDDNALNNILFLNRLSWFRHLNGSNNNFSYLAIFFAAAAEKPKAPDDFGAAVIRNF